jgi:predicted Rossmann fold flavoprotein
MSKSKDKFDVAVIGGGPAGMMAAGRAAELGARVVLLEKNDKPGRKLLMTGNGRCNLTHAGLDTRGMVERYGKEGKFLFSPFTAFGVNEVMDFFARRGLPTKVEGDGRVFPVTDKALDVLSVLLGYMKEGGVKIKTGISVSGFERDGGRIRGVVIPDGEVAARNFVICTGGRSYPATGSTGDGYRWMTRLGHSITAPAPALVPVTLKEAWVRELEGTSFQGAGIFVYQGGRKQAGCTGDGVFTSNGISGPAILNLSKDIRRLLTGGEVRLVLDLMPGMDMKGLDAHMQGMFRENQNRLLKNSLGGIITLKMVPLALRLAGIQEDIAINRLTRDGRIGLCKVVKGLEMTVRGLAGFEKAMVTAGGVSLKEIDSRSMRSKLIDNLYLAGEIIDIDGPTGGYNLQVCWSTGYVAGGHAAKG